MLLGARHIGQVGEIERFPFQQYAHSQYLRIENVSVYEAKRRVWDSKGMTGWVLRNIESLT